MGQNRPPTLERTDVVNETSFDEVVTRIKVWVNYFKTKWLLILITGVIFCIASFFFTKSVRPHYIAECTFVLDEDNGAKVSSGLSALGLGMGGKSAGFFTETDNIIWLYSTRLLLQKTLLTPVDSLGKKILLINWFLSESNLRREFDKDPLLSKTRFDFNTNDSWLNRAQNTIITRCANLIKNRYLKVQLTPKTENVISVTFKSKNELFAALFTNELVANVNDYYIQTKTKKASAEVALLESKANQYKSEMSSSMYEVASEYDDAPYANPSRTVLRVAPQRKQVDAKIASEIYGGLVQQLELSRTSLQKQIPLIQIIEQPVLPLKTDMSDPKLMSVLGLIGGIILITIILVCVRLYKTLFVS
ncbi:MAG: hypothetical protein WC756_06995 [Taibaiella sp.]|jgi:hypothetical protein